MATHIGNWTLDVDKRWATADGRFELLPCRGQWLVSAQNNADKSLLATVGISSTLPNLREAVEICHTVAGSSTRIERPMPSYVINETPLRLVKRDGRWTIKRYIIEMSRSYRTSSGYTVNWVSVVNHFYGHQFHTRAAALDALDALLDNLPEQYRAPHKRRFS